MTNTITLKKAHTEKKSNKLLGSNPMIRKISRITERSEDHVTVAGIANKCIFFMLTLLIGVMAALLLQNVGMTIHLGSIETDQLTIALSEVSVTGLIIMFFSAIMILIIPIITFFAKKAAAVLGTVFCFSTGYVFAFLAMLFEEYRAAVSIALIITAAICTAMFFLYRTGKVVVTNKLRTVVFTLVFANILSGIALLVCYFIPGLHFIAEFAASNSILTVICSIVGIVIASLFLLVDFDAVNKAVENKIPLENEWYCAFGLAFSVIWLFMKVLNLVIRVMAKNNK